MKILIAYDGSECADAALDDLQKAGLARDGVEAIVISVAEVWLPPPPPSVYEIADAMTDTHTPRQLQHWYGAKTEKVVSAERLGACAAGRIKGNFPAWSVMSEASCGSPAWEVIMKADRWRPDLVVVGSHGRNALGRFVLGSVSQKVLTEARTSVRVARGRVEVEPGPTRVVIGLDGSAAAHAAVTEVASRAWPSDSEIKVIVVSDPVGLPPVDSFIPQVTSWLEETSQTERDWLKNMAGLAIDELREARLRANVAFVVGDPKQVLIDEAEKWHADSIFVGSTGFGNRFERFLLGSVSGAVAARAHCSVEVVRVRTVGDE